MWLLLFGLAMIGNSRTKPASEYDLNVAVTEAGIATNIVSQAGSTGVSTAVSSVSQTESSAASSLSANVSVATSDGLAASSAASSLASYDIPATESATAAATGFVNIPPGTRVWDLEPTGNCTLQTSGGNPSAGQEFCLIVHTINGSGYTVSFGSGFKSQGTLATAASAGLYYVVRFVWSTNYSIWAEFSRVGPIS